MGNPKTIFRCGYTIFNELKLVVPTPLNSYEFLIDLYIRTQKGTIPIENIQLEKEKWQKLCAQAINAEEIILATCSNSPINQYDSMLDSKNMPKKRGRKPRGKALTLLDRLLKHTDPILAFAEFQAVPFTNNQAERDIRPIKTKLKISGCFRTSDGAKRYAYTAERSGDGKTIRLVCTDANGSFEVYKTIPFLQI